MKTIKGWLQDLPDGYTLEQAIERLGKDFWNVRNDNASNPNNIFILAKERNTPWQPLRGGYIRVEDFSTALDQLSAAIEACVLLNGAKKETV